MSTVLLALCVLSAQFFTVERVVAVVGSEPLLHSQVVTLMIESGVDEDLAATADVSSDIYMAALEQAIDEKLLVEAARRASVYPTREQIEEAVEEAMSQASSSFSSQRDFDAFLASMGMTSRLLRESYSSLMADRLAGENFVRSRASRVMASAPMDPVAYFESNPEAVETVLAPRALAWIYIPVLPGDTGEAHSLMLDIRQSIERGETTFAAAALQYSQDSSADTGGDLGWFGRGDMTATFEKQVYQMQPGEITGPFVSPFGVHLVKINDRDGESVRASHILRLVEITPADIDSALALAERTVADLEAGADFAQMALTRSAHPSTYLTGGMLGIVNVGAWEGDIRSSVIELAPGEFSRPVLIEQSTAVAVFHRVPGVSENDWSSFTANELDSMLQSLFWNTYYDRMVDSLRTEIPVLINIQ
jgi:hypothetical protein